MAREKEMLREQLARISEAFPGKECLTATEVARWMGKDVKTVRRAFSFKKPFGISIVQLAREMLP